MKTSIPVVEDANVWGLVNLKRNKRRTQPKLLNQLYNKNKPLEKPDGISEIKVARRAGFAKVKGELGLWKGPVHRNRLADQLIFPLKDNSIVMANSEEAKEMKQNSHISANSTDSSDVTTKLYTALYGKRELSNSSMKTEEKRLQAAANEIMAKIAERAKDRFHLAKLAQRNKRVNKIKSKSYHRRSNKRLMKEYEKETELLRMNDPKAFADRLLKAEHLRAKERLSLRHKSGGKFVKMQKLRAKYDKEARDAVADMYERSRQLTQKRGGDSDSDDSDVDLSSDPDESATEAESSDADADGTASKDPVKPFMWWQNSIENKEMAKPQVSTSSKPAVLISSLAAESTLDKSEAYAKELKASSGADEDMLDPTSDEFFSAIQEACGSDAVLQSQFSEEKNQAIEEETPQDLDTFLPGWNTWTGPGTEVEDERRRKRRIIPAPRVKRADGDKSHVLLRRRLNKEYRDHLIKKIPFPYNTPEQFETVIEQPICREWMTETVHHDLTRPKVLIQSGRIIRPISKTATLLKDKDVAALKSKKKSG